MLGNLDKFNLKSQTADALLCVLSEFIEITVREAVEKEIAKHDLNVQQTTYNACSRIIAALQNA